MVKTAGAVGGLLLGLLMGGEIAAGEVAPASAGATPVASAPQGPFMTVGRVEKDDGRDTLRYPNELMAFLAIKPGSTVVDLGAGDGYTSMYLAREVGPEGAVYAQNPPAWSDYLVPALKDRLKGGPLVGITWIDQPFEAAIPPEIQGVDLVTNVLTYHDTLYMTVDREKMNANVYGALRPGGRYVIVDHAAREADAGDVGGTLHRVSEAFLIAEVERAGFALSSRSEIMRDASDDHTGVAWAEPQPRTDRFVLSFVKPVAEGG